MPQWKVTRRHWAPPIFPWGELSLARPHPWKYTLTWAKRQAPTRFVRNLTSSLCFQSASRADPFRIHPRDSFHARVCRESNTTSRHPIACPGDGSNTCPFGERLRCWELLMPPQTDSEAWHHQRTASKHNGATTRAHGGMKTIKPGKRPLPAVHVSMDQLRTQKTLT